MCLEEVDLLLNLTLGGAVSFITPRAGHTTLLLSPSDWALGKSLGSIVLALYADAE